MSRGYLLDTCVLSALAPGKGVERSTLAQWIHRHSDRLFISAVTVAEIEQGISKLRRMGGAERAARLSLWVGGLASQGSDRILAFGTEAARIAGQLSDAAMGAGRHPGFADVAIAATAKAHGLVVVTHNVRHFAALGVELLDPSQPCPAPSLGG